MFVFFSVYECWCWIFLDHLLQVILCRRMELACLTRFFSSRASSPVAIMKYSFLNKWRLCCLSPDSLILPCVTKMLIFSCLLSQHLHLPRCFLSPRNNIFLRSLHRFQAPSSSLYSLRYGIDFSFLREGFSLWE